MHLLLFIVLFFPITLSAQKFISKEKALADIDSLHSIIRQVHYNPYLHITEEDFLTRINEVKKNIGDSIELKSFLKQLYFLVYAMEDSHTGPAIVQQELRPELVKPIFAPFYFIADEKTNVYVSNDNPLIQKGSRIISVNGKNTSDLFREATTLWGGNKEFSFDMAERFLSYYFFLSGIQAPFVFEYEREGKKNTIEIKEGVNFSKALSLTLPQMARKAFSFKVIENKIAWIEFNSMSESIDKFQSFLDSAMNVINTSKLQVLVVDIRNNSGGNSALGDLLLTHLTKKKFSLMGKRYWRVSDRYKAYLLSQGNTSHKYLKKQDGILWERGNCKPSKSPFRVKEVYEGKVYFITGPFTFSSANMIADGVKQYKLATILGEPTGENTNDFGEVYSFELPGSKIRFNTTTSYDIGADCNDKKMSPVIPNVHIPLTTADKLEGRDPVMDYILKKH